MKPLGRSWPQRFSPLGVWEQVPMPTVAARLRAIFARWGLPERIRVDNGQPWGLHPDLPQDLARWWLGLGIAVIWNHPRHPQENGVVERAQSLTGQWAEPAHCPSYAALQGRLNWAAQIQREQYPAAAGQSRVAAYPALSGGGRPYDPEREAATWDLQRVCGYLGQGLWRRRVDKAGKIYLYNRPYQALERPACQWGGVGVAAHQREQGPLAADGDEAHRRLA